MVGGSAPASREHCSFNIGGKNGLNETLGMQLASASKNALQQAGPMLPNRPLKIAWEISVMHPGIFTDDQHFVISGNPSMPGVGWNGKGKGNCGNNWAFVETTTHTTTRRRRTFLRDIMRILVAENVFLCEVC